MPQIVKYYLGEEILIPNVPTLMCAVDADRKHVLANLADLVVKPIDGSGGIGGVIGPEATPEALDDRRRELQSQPERFIAQEAIALSTHPTFDGEGMYPHHVDLRAFVHLRPDGMNGVTAEVMPAGLTRVAAHGSRIVNSSSGGGSKDTWILTGGPHDPGTS